MRKVFVKTNNVERFLNAVAAVETRGAPEASFLLVGGDAGYGKSKTGLWWAVNNQAVYVRIKAAATPHWVLQDLVVELGEQAPAHSCEKLFAQAVGSLARSRRPLVIDEVENALDRDMAILETIRDIGDFTEVPVILLGREYVKSRLKRHRQIWTRISAIAEFGPASLEDVGRCCEELAEVEIAPEVVALIHDQSEGHIREVVKAIKNVERIGLRQKGRAVTLADIGSQPLTQEWQRKGAATKPNSASRLERVA